MSADLEILQIDVLQAAMLKSAAQEWENPRAAATNDLSTWALRRLGETFWSAQREIADSLRDHRYTAVQSCHDSGKSYIASRAAAHWIDTHPDGDAFVVSTAPTAAQVYAILWREISKAHRKGGLPGRIINSGYPQWKIDGELRGYGRKPADYEESAFQGIHDKYVLVIVDEACGIDANLWNAIDALVTNEYARVLAIGNPDDPGSHFAQLCKHDSGWNVIRIDGLRTPGMTKTRVDNTHCPICKGKPRLLRRLMREEGITYTTEVIPPDLYDFLISPLWIEERLHRWVGPPSPGQNLARKAALSSLFTAKVRGLFPESGTEGVIPLGWIQRAVDRWQDWVDAGSPERPGRQVLGVDVAGEGEDENAIYKRQGDAPLEIWRAASIDTVELAAVVRAKANGAHASAVVDVTGIGAGVADQLRHLDDPLPVLAFVAAARTDRTDAGGEFRFRNVRSAAWWHLREMLDPRTNPTLMLPNDELLIGDLVAPRWQVYAGGIIGIEPKDSIRKRLGRSTDTGDACVQAHWVDAGPVDGSYGSGGVLPWDSTPTTGAIPWSDDVWH